ncbi:hypothetical protein Bca52824_002789 [Brassica carinata]|uniref:Uncharacterized protein n=1 Tax=Brassica carinata TaxID=52824 RepID=A0A8X7WKV8_BRACI|nr:hypothetical protein Bca52824_002789 [Brassica carinata]
MEKCCYSAFDMDEREQSNFSMKRQLLCVVVGLSFGIAEKKNHFVEPVKEKPNTLDSSLEGDFLLLPRSSASEKIQGELTMGQDYSYSQPSSSEFDTTSLLLAEAELYAAEVESDYSIDEPVHYPTQP